MKKVIKTITIPEKSFDITLFVARDGMELNSEESCMAYEKELDLKEHWLFKNSIECCTYYDEYNARLYYLENKEDFNFIVEHCVHNKNLDTDFDHFGEGWYIFWEDEMGDGPSFFNLLNYEKYVQNIEKELNTWKGKINAEILKICK